MYEIERLIARWYARAPGDGDGETPADIAAAERRLGIRFPAILAEFYRRFGARCRRENEVDVGFWVPPLDALGPQHLDDGLFYCLIEDHAGMRFGVELGPDDPRVLFGGHLPESVDLDEQPIPGGTEAADSLSRMLVDLAHVQTLAGLLECAGDRGPFGPVRQGLFTDWTGLAPPDPTEGGPFFRWWTNGEVVIARDFMYLERWVLAESADAARPYLG